MNEHFFDLKKEKQSRMLAGILKVFALKGYRDAGTDEMTREAGISKGLLFHYFGTKEGAFLFVCEYLLRYLELEISESLPAEAEDPFVVMEKAQTALSHILQVLPYAGLFCFRLESEPAIDLPEKAYGPREGLKKLCVMIREKMDFSALPSEPGEEMILEMMICQIRGLQEMLLSSGELNVRDYLQRVRTFLDLLALSVRSVGGITAL